MARLLQIISVRQLNVYVKLPGGKTLTMQVRNVGTIKEIKESISCVEDLSAASLVLKV
jgi:hypothetical protein